MVESELQQFMEAESLKRNKAHTSFDASGFASTGKLKYIHSASTPNYLAEMGLVERNGWELTDPTDIDPEGFYSEMNGSESSYSIEVWVDSATTAPVVKLLLPHRIFWITNTVSRKIKMIHVLGNVSEAGKYEAFGSYEDCVGWAWAFLEHLQPSSKFHLKAKPGSIARTLDQSANCGFIKWVALNDRGEVTDEALSRAILRVNPELDKRYPLSWRIALL
jgi:hypothetical protein